MKKKQFTTNDLRNNQIIFKDAPLLSKPFRRAPVYPGTNYIDLGTATRLYNELTNFQPTSTDTSFTANRAWFMNLGTVNIDDSGADWTLDADNNTLVPNSVAKQIELKLGLVDAKIKNSMYTDLDILRVSPAIDTALSKNVRSNGAVYTRYLLGSKYNTFVLTKFWTDLQSLVSTVVLASQNNKLLFDRANILINELKRARIRAALQSLEAASSMVMTDIVTAGNVIKNSGVMKIRPDLTAPIINVQMSMNRDIYANKDTWLAVRYANENQDIKLTLDVEPITSPRTAIMNLLTATDADWVKFVQQVGNEVHEAATNLTLSIADIQKPYQWLNTAIMQIGSEVFQDRYAFRKISIDIFQPCAVEIEPLLNLSIFKNVKIDFNTHNALAKTVLATVPCNIQNVPVDACKTNFVLALHDCPGEYKSLVDISKFGLSEVLYWTDGTPSDATPCSVLNGNICVIKASYVSMKWMGIDGFNMLSIGESGKNYSSYALYNMRKLFLQMFPYFYLYNGAASTYYMEENTYGLVQVAYTPILDSLLLNATSNFGLK